MARIGYTRAANLDRDHTPQEARFHAAGCESIRKEKASCKATLAATSWLQSSHSFGSETSWWW
jgi:hypothetical protein